MYERYVFSCKHLKKKNTNDQKAIRRACKASEWNQTLLSVDIDLPSQTNSQNYLFLSGGCLFV